ncbi:MAG: pyridoxamine 5'-phosphate oxidase family protein [Acidimicrobiales bacterium]|nr:pyridoxamine 5'-phosphate oxidase family protein [Acidimicrobiales bacterium]
MENESSTTGADATGEHKEVALLQDRQGLEVLSWDECLDKLRHHSVGRVGFLDRGETVILPVNYAYIGASVLFRTTTGSILHNVMMNDQMSFEIDEWDEEERSGWSVLVKGQSVPVDDEWQKTLFDTLGVDPWADAIERNEYVRIRADEITGRRIVHLH